MRGKKGRRSRASERSKGGILVPSDLQTQVRHLWSHARKFKEALEGTGDVSMVLRC